MAFVLKKFIPAFVFLIILTVLLCLPGNTLPTTSGNWFQLVHADKLIHIFLFATLTYLCCMPITLKGFVKSILSKLYFVIALIATFYGFIMELVQHWFIPGRAFEGLDILADAIGCFIGYYIAKCILNKQVALTNQQLQQEAIAYAKGFAKDKLRVKL